MTTEPPSVPGVGVWFYTNTGVTQETAHVHATRVGRLAYGNTVNIYKLDHGKDPSQAKLAMYGVKLTSSKTSFYLGGVKMNPGDSLFALIDKKGLEFKVAVPLVAEAPPFDQFADLFG